MFRRFHIVAAAGFALAAPGGALAQSQYDAETLPQGAGGVIIQPGFGYGPGSLQRFGRGWQSGRESLIADFNGIDLTSVIAGEEAAEGIRNTLGDLGTTSFVGEQTAFAINFMAAFGITDRLTVAALLPFMRVKYTLDAYLEPGPNQSAYRVKNPDAITCPGGDFQIDAEQFGEIVEDGGAGYLFNVGDLNRALISDCLGYRPVIDRVELRDGQLHGIGDRSFAGFRDFILAAKYQWWHGRHFNLATMGYVVFPTGKPDDPDDLFDFSFGDGNWDAALLGMITVPFGDFTLAASAGYEIQFADSLVRRLDSLSFSADLETQLARGQITEAQLLSEHLDNGQRIPVVTRFDKMEVQRKLGDNIYGYSYLNYQILEWLGAGVSMTFLHHFRDNITDLGPRPEGAPAYKTEAEIRAEVDELVANGTIEEAEREDALKVRFPESRGRKIAAYSWRTVRGQLAAGIGINFNTLGMFLRDEFPLPIIASISISRFLAGQNIDTPDALNLSLIIPFAVGDVKDPAEYGFDDDPGHGLPWP